MKLFSRIEFLNEKRKAEDLISLMNKKLESLDIQLKEDHRDLEILKGGERIGDLRISENEDGWVYVHMIDIDEKMQKKGIGTSIYQALLDSALELGKKGLFSSAFDNDTTGQQRSPGATALLNKLIKTNGGTIQEVEVDDEFIEELEEEGAPFYGPPYLDFYVDGSKEVKKIEK